MSLLLILLALQTLCTLLMTGIIWMVQVVHYPLMHAVGDTAFTAYAHQHQTAITYLVGPLMLGEAITAVACLYCSDSMMSLQPWQWVGIGLLLVIWASTAFLQVPCHEVLRHGYDASTVQRLVDSNWIRTVAWTLRAGVLVGVWVLLWKAHPHTHA